MAFVQYVRSRVEVIALNVAAGVDPDSVECRQLSEAAAQGITQVAAGVRNLTAGLVVLPARRQRESAHSVQL